MKTPTQTLITYKLNTMNEKTIDTVINILYSLSVTAILLGAFFKLQHYPYGNQLVWGGIIAQFIFSSIEISRLKKTIKKLEERKLAE
ncbi:MAG: hypothetical protein K0M40_00145 [Prolixibacteraceae bacterium]|nr:hypothetical protein [Prolixibacteraceae bacterium]